MSPSPAEVAGGGQSEFKRRRRRSPASKLGPCFSLSFLISSLFVILQATNLTRSQFLQQAPQEAPRQAPQAHLLANQTSSNNQTSANSKAEFLLNLVKSSFNSQAANGSSASMSSSSSSISNSPAGGASGRSLAPLLRAIENEKKQRAGQQREHYKTVYACEGNQLELGCPEGRLIHLSRALYGRFSLSICNEGGHSNYSVQCASFRAFLIMETRCNKLSNCSVTASKELFGEPCEGTSKYLEVQYYCHDVNQPAAASQMPAGPRATATSGNQEQSSAKLETPSNNQPDTPSAKPGHKSQAGELFVGGAGPERSSSAGELQQQDGPPPIDNQQQQEKQPQTSSAVIQGPFCSPQTSSRNLFWNATRADQLARQPCPEGAQGRVSWFCDGSQAHAGLLGPRFAPAWSPDFSQCRLVWLLNLEKQLERILLVGSELPAWDSVRQQCEQLNAVVLTDLALMARTKELFSEDLRKIEQLLGRTLAHFRLLLEGQQQQQLQARSFNKQALFEDLFAKVVDVCSSLFELAQRNAWLEMAQPEVRRALEARLLAHLREAGLLASGAWPAGELELPSVRRPNVRAGLSALNGNANGNGNNFDAFRHAVDTDEFNLAPLATKAHGPFNYLSRLYQQPGLLDTSGADSSLGQQAANEFKVNTQLVRELVYKGATRFLVVDVRKPDYALMRQQLELGALEPNNNLLPAGEQQQQSAGSQVFGLFAVDYSARRVIKNEDSLGNRQEQALKWAELLAKWPISVHFRQPLPFAEPATGASQRQLHRECNLLTTTTSDDSLDSQPTTGSRCQTFKLNATDYVCRCDGFGFVTLASQPLPVGLLTTPNDIHWPPVQDPLDNSLPATDFLDARNQEAPLATISAGSSAATSKQTSAGVWRSLLTVLGSLVVLVAFAALVVGAFLRASASSRLNKKHNFLPVGTSCNGSIFASGPPSGPGNPLAPEHGLIADTIVSNSAAGSNATSVATSSTFGLAGANCYKTHQQLYASHLPPVDSRRLARGWSSWLPRLPTGNWLSRLLGNSGEQAAKLEQQQRAHHQAALAASQQSSLAYKGHYQNGYTTGLHRQPLNQPLSQQQHRIPLTSAPTSSSTSSYVSSSAYYEEIGPGNLTKLNAHQLVPGARALTMVEPFKRQPAATDQQHLISAGSHLNQQPPAWLLNNSLAQQPTGNCHEQMFTQPRPLGGQQHSPGSGGQPAPGRHYLFASSTAVNAYKSSMGQPTHTSFKQQLPPGTGARFSES